MKQLHREGTALADMALLYRSNAQSRILEHALFRAGIAYKVYGGCRFFERQEVKHALAYLRLAANLDDDTAFSRVVNFPPRGIGARRVEQLQETAASGLGSLARAANAGAVAGRGGTAIAGFMAIVERLRKASETLTLPELIEEVLAASSLKDHYASERDGQDRVENLNELVNAATLFNEEFEVGVEPAGEAQEDVAPVPVTHQQQVWRRSFRTRASGGEHRGRRRGRAAAHDGAFLERPEFDAVFLGLEEGLFPHDNSLNEDGGIENGALMYVAITPREEAPYLSTPQPHAARAAALRDRVALRRGDSGGAVQVDSCCRTKRPGRRRRSRAGRSRLGRGGGSAENRGRQRRTRPRADPNQYATAPRANFETSRPASILRDRRERAPREVRRGRGDQLRGSGSTPGCRVPSARKATNGGAAVRQAHPA